MTYDLSRWPNAPQPEAPDRWEPDPEEPDPDREYERARDRELEDAG